MFFLLNPSLTFQQKKHSEADLFLFLFPNISRTKGCEACASWRMNTDEEAPVAIKEHLRECMAFASLRAGRDIVYNTNDIFSDVLRVRATGK